MARRSASRRRSPSNCRRRARCCSSGRAARPSGCGSPRRSAFCSTRFDALVAAQCDLPALRDWPAAATLMARIGVALRAAAFDLQQLSLELLTNRQAAPAARPRGGDRRDAARGGAARGERRARARGSARRSRRPCARLLDLRRHVAPSRARDLRRCGRRRGDRRSRSLRSSRRAAPIDPRHIWRAVHAGFAGVPLRHPPDRGDGRRARSSRAASATPAMAIGCC